MAFYDVFAWTIFMNPKSISSFYRYEANTEKFEFTYCHGDISNRVVVSVSFYTNKSTHRMKLEAIETLLVYFKTIYSELPIQKHRKY